MSIAPVPGTILDFIAALNQGLQARQSLDSTLAQALRVLVDSWPDAEAARLYWPDGTEAATTDASSTGALSGAVTLEVPLYNDGHWFVALHEDSDLLGVLEVAGTLPEAGDWLQLVAVQLSQAIVKHEAQLLEGLSHGLSSAQDILDVLRSLQSLVPSAGEFNRAAAVYHNQQIQDVVVTHTLTGDQEALVNISLREIHGADVIAALTGFPAPDVCLLLAPNPTGDSESSTLVMPFFEGDILREIIRVDFAASQPLAAHIRRMMDAARQQIAVVLHALQQVSDVKSSAALLEQQVPVLRLLSELSTVISITKDEHQLLNQSAQAFVEVLQADYCRVYLLDASAQGGTIFCEYPHRGTSGKPFKLADLPLKTLPDADNPMPLVVNDVQADARLSDEGRAGLRAEGVKAFVLMPLFVRGNLTSLFRLDITRENRHFTPELQDLMQTVLAQVVVGLQNIRLLEGAQQNSDQLRRANQFGQTLQSTLEIEIIVRAALSESLRVIPMEHMTIALRDSHDSRLRVVGQYANNEHTVTLSGGPELTLEDAMVSEVWETQQPAYIPDVAENNPLRDESRSVLVVPLIARGDTQGLVFVGHSQAYLYNETDVIVFQQMMAQFAAAVENARLFEESTHIARRAALINEIGSRMQTSTSVEHTLNEAARGLQQALHAGRVSIRLGGPPATPDNTPNGQKEG